MKHIQKEQLNKFLETVANDYKVLAPVQQNDIVKFVPWQKGQKLELDRNTTIPPKDIFFPQSEDLYTFQKIDGKSVVKPQEEVEKQILFGVRACDAKSFAMMDDVFLTKGFVDNYYKNKRENTLVISLGCKEVCSYSFCTAMQIAQQDAEGVDVNFLDAGATYAVIAKTPAGEEFLAKYAAFFQEGSEVKPVHLQSPIDVSYDGLAEKLAKMFEHGVWEEIYRKCIGCGTCTYVCPTCHCFDITGEKTGEMGIKLRCWDTCMFSEYTRMAGGHNPRPSRKERFRNRFLHKLQFFPERYGKTACVGCGRCIAKCPVGVDITRIIEKLQEVDINA